MVDGVAGDVGLEHDMRRDGKAERVELTNRPVFVYHRDASLDVSGVGRMRVDVAYGGMTFVLVDAAACGLALDPS